MANRSYPDDETIKQLRIVELDLSGNQVGDEGVRLLAPILSRIKKLRLSHVGLTDSGCHALLDCLSLEICELNVVSRNLIGDSGVGVLASRLVGIGCVGLSTSVGMTEAGCERLAVCLSDAATLVRDQVTSSTWI